MQHQPDGLYSSCARSLRYLPNPAALARAFSELPVDRQRQMAEGFGVTPDQFQTFVRQLSGVDPEAMQRIMVGLAHASYMQAQGGGQGGAGGGGGRVEIRLSQAESEAVQRVREWVNGTGSTWRP